MNITPIRNTQTFSGRIAETELGNEYEKCNTGKMINPLINMGLGVITYSTVSIPRGGNKAAGLLFVLPLAALGGFIEGAITDAVINSRRKKDTDMLAIKGEVKEKTNNGKIITGGIGLALGALTALSRRRMIDLPISFANALTWGTIYDYEVNKSREQLKSQAERA